MLKLVVLFGAAALSASACRDSRPQRAPLQQGPAGAAVVAVEAPVAPVVPYALAAPSRVVELVPALREISGLTVLANGRLGAVQDEAGTLYELDPATGAILSETPFRDSGDFEGVEQAGPDVWALRSDGDLYRLRPAGGNAEPASIERFKTDLADRNDTEGLAYDAAGQRLLIACKENPGKGLGDVRAVYAFSLRTNTLSAAPVFTLDRTRLDADKPFKPSAIAIRPATGDIYVLSSVRKALAVLAADGTVRAVVDLPEALYPQPEGIAFAPDGTLYISNEGPHGPATLLRFDPTDR